MKENKADKGSENLSEMLGVLARCADPGAKPATVAELDVLNAGFAGPEQWLGLRYTSISSERVEASMVVQQCHMQPWGDVHGGVYAMCAESVASILATMGAIAASKTHAVGMTNSTEFLAPVRSGVLAVVAIPVRQGYISPLFDVAMFQRDKLVAVSRVRTIQKPTQQAHGR